MFFRKKITLEQAVEKFVGMNTLMLNRTVKSLYERDICILSKFSECGTEGTEDFKYDRFRERTNVSINHQRNFHYDVLNWWVFTQTEHIEDKARLYSIIKTQMAIAVDYLWNPLIPEISMTARTFGEKISYDERILYEETTEDFLRMYEAEIQIKWKSSAKKLLFRCLKYKQIPWDDTYTNIYRLFENVYLEQTLNESSWEQFFKGYRIT